MKRTSYPCRDCKHDKGRCAGTNRNGSHKFCFEEKTPTNADRIRSMSDEGLAQFLWEQNGSNCYWKTPEKYLVWLRETAAN